MTYRENYTCLVCHNSTLVEYLDLTDQPLANSYHKGEALDKYPLKIKVCTTCWHSQLSASVDPSVMFEHYLYISDTTKTLTDYFKWVTKYILDSMPKPKNVLEIACNSGLLLEMFQKQGIPSYGVDPAKNLRELSEKRGLNVYVDYWDRTFAEKLKQEVGTFDLIMGFHVLPHVLNPNDFIQSCASVLSDDGIIFLQTSQCDMFLNNEFDVIYHEHSSYFTGRSIQVLAHSNGLYVGSIIKTDIHGKSFLFSLQKKFSAETQLEQLIIEEANNGIYSIEKYYDFAKKAADIKTELRSGLRKFKKNGYTIIGYGAAAKGNTLLNYIRFKLDYIIDDNPMKWGYQTPGMDIDICPIQLLQDKQFEKICFVPLAWNFYTEIRNRIAAVRDTQNDVFLRYFPDYKEEKNAIEVKTQFPIATASDDHIHPDGIYYDNNMNPAFAYSVESFFLGKRINFLDLGCAGGELVCQFAKNGHNSVGLEGSDHCLNIRSEMVQQVGEPPAGAANWALYGNKRLFTCDITKEYEILENSSLMQFDLITCWDVMEHFQPEDIESFLQMVSKHLKPFGIFVASIALFDVFKLDRSNNPTTINYHKSVFPKEWWKEKLEQHFKSIPYPFADTNRLFIIDHPDTYFLYTGMK